MADTTATTPPGGVAPAPTLSEQFAAHAQDLFGVQDDGSFKDKEPTQAAPTEPTEPTEPAEPAEPAEPEVTEPPEPIAFEELAKAYELTTEELAERLQIGTDVNGQKATKALKDVLKGYQLDQHNTQKSQELSRQADALKAQEKQYQEYFKSANEQVKTLNAQAQYAQQMLNQDFQAINWAELEATDPTRYIILQNKYNQRQSAINAFVGQVNQESQKLQLQAKQGQDQKIAETVQSLQNEYPQFRDMNTFNKECDTIANTLKTNYGLPAQDLPVLLTNPAYFKIADAASKYWALQQQKPAAVQRVKEAPKLVKAGVRKGSNPASPYAEARTRALKSGDSADWASAFETYADATGLKQSPR